MTQPRGKKAAARAARREAALRRRKRRRLLLLVGGGAAVIAAVVFALTRPMPPELAELETFPDMGGGHLAVGEDPPAYNSDPPTSGRHSSTPAQCGIYTEAVPDPLQVHNLEHGTVIIQHQPDFADVDLLHRFARAQLGHILVAPRPGLADPVVLTAWTRLLRLDGADMGAVQAFYDTFRGRGPEVGVPCPFAVDQG